MTRRQLVTKLSEQRREEVSTELATAIAEAKTSAVQLSDRFKLPLAFVQHKMEHLCGCQNGMVGTYHRSADHPVHTARSDSA